MAAFPESDPSDSAEILGFPARSGTHVGRLLEGAYRETHPILVGFLVRRLGNQLEAQDVAQAAFLKLWERRETLRDQNLVSLLFTTARNAATDIIRGRAIRDHASLSDADCGSDGVMDDAPSAERSVIAAHELEMVRRVVDELPVKCRRAFILFKFEGFSYLDTAARMGVTESMVRKYVRRALAHCVQRFAELDGWE